MKKLAIILALAFTMGLSASSVSAATKDKKEKTECCAKKEKKECCAKKEAKACCAEKKAEVKK